ncbi:putative xyloglucan glycosyltransferase 9 [Iris pallida]|uniref:Xyloglucan glycosyltransferase 9 n=1 Tax=Iris pallida TaxID=29817 RepID=A0AAX6HPI3_IRIPA|nr:putative xyloglucan glycosyltransferase 9 [Iris pallida]
MAPWWWAKEGPQGDPGGGQDGEPNWSMVEISSLDDDDDAVAAAPGDFASVRKGRARGRTRSRSRGSSSSGPQGRRLPHLARGRGPSVSPPPSGGASASGKTDFRAGVRRQGGAGGPEVPEPVLHVHKALPLAVGGAPRLRGRRVLQRMAHRHVGTCRS